MREAGTVEALVARWACQIGGALDHLDELAAFELEVGAFVVLEDGGVVGFCVFEGGVDVAAEDLGADAFRRG